jgi:hypothetical protein
MKRSAARRSFYLVMAAAFLALALPRASAIPRTLTEQIPGRPIRSSSHVTASSPPAIESVGALGGIIPTFAVNGTLAFLIQGSLLTVLDISTPAAPTRIGHIPLLWGADTLAVADGIVYAAAYGIVQIIDVHNPALPVEVARFRAHAAVDHIQVVGTSAYLTEGSDGVEIVDISDLSRPMHLAQYAQPVCRGCFLVVGNLAYVTNYSNVLTILDISNPSVPITRGSFTLSAPAQTEFWRVVVEDKRAYIGALTSVSSGVQPRLITLDITHPEHPLLLGNAELPAPVVTVSGDIAYTKSDTQLQIFDIGDPAHPIARGTYTGTLMQVIGEIVQVVGDRVYLADYLAALKLLDVSNPDNPIVLGSYATPPGLKYPDSIQVVGSTGYVQSRGLQVLDLTTPISPTLRGHYASEYALSIHVAGGHAYMDIGDNQLKLLDVSDPDVPALMGTLPLRFAQAVVEVQNRAYILAVEPASCGRSCIIYHHVLNAVDVSTPAAPQILGRIQLFDSNSIDTGSVIVKGAFAYIAWGGALRIVDVTIPAMPVARATFPIAASGNRMQMLGNLAYVTSMAGLSILDLTDPLKPILLGRTGSLGDVAYSIQVQGSLAFVGSSSGVRVIDISHPTRPIPRASYADARGPVDVVGDLIYVAGGTAGLHMLRLHADRFPPPMFMPLARH